MSDATAKIRSKGCEGTGLTEEDAARLHTKVGTHFMAIVELKVAQRHGPDAEGKTGVDLTIEQLEPAEKGSDLDVHLRELTRTTYYNRALNSEEKDGQLRLDSQSDTEPTVAEQIAAGKKLEPHDFMPTIEDDVTICDVCGEDDDDARHQVNDQAGTPVTEPATDDPDQGPTVTEPAPEEPSGEPVEEPAAEPAPEPSNVIGFSSGR